MRFIKQLTKSAINFSLSKLWAEVDELKKEIDELKAGPVAEVKSTAPAPAEKEAESIDALREQAKARKIPGWHKMGAEKLTAALSKPNPTEGDSNVN